MNETAPTPISGRETKNRAATRLRPQSDRRSFEYRFESEWLIPASAERTATVLGDPLACLTWWPAAFLRGELLKSGNREEMGALVRFLVKGWLPYTIQFVARIEESELPEKLTLEAAGDFEGKMQCELETLSNGTTLVRSDWAVRVHHPFIRRFSFLFRHIFAWNHRWAMKNGETGLSLATAGDSPEKVAGYPQPTFPHNWRAFLDRVRWKPWTASWELARARARAKA